MHKNGEDVGDRANVAHGGEEQQIYSTVRKADVANDNELATDRMTIGNMSRETRKRRMPGKNIALGPTKTEIKGTFCNLVDLPPDRHRLHFQRGQDDAEASRLKSTKLGGTGIWRRRQPSAGEFVRVRP